MAMEVEGKPVPMSAGLGEDEFTEADLAAADQLVQLSVSGGWEEDREASSSSSLMSARSVNKAEAPAGEDDDETELDRRARKRYRLVSELYAATRLVKGGGKTEECPGRRGLCVNTFFS